MRAPVASTRPGTRPAPALARRQRLCQDGCNHHEEDPRCLSSSERIDQGTTSTRFMVFDSDGTPIASRQLEHRADPAPRPGWVEHDPLEIVRAHRDRRSRRAGERKLGAADLAAIGITNQRETTVVWNRNTGRPWCNAIVWQDTRTDRLAAALEPAAAATSSGASAGLPPATYFSAGKLRWILDNVDGRPAGRGRRRGRLRHHRLWLLWNLTGGPAGGVHVTDVTNASRTMLMNLADVGLGCRAARFRSASRASMLPAIRPSSESAGSARRRRRAVRRRGAADRAILGDQQAAMVGQACFTAGEAKNTYGTGNFLLLNTGTRTSCRRRHGLLTTVCVRVRATSRRCSRSRGRLPSPARPCSGCATRLGLIIADAAEIEPLAGGVPDNGGVYFVPAFSGLFAPYWRSDARGAIVGLTRFNDRGHLARATLEAICLPDPRRAPTRMERDSGVALERAQGRRRRHRQQPLMQLQADILGVPWCAARRRRDHVARRRVRGRASGGLWSGSRAAARQLEGRPPLGPDLVRGSPGGRLPGLEARGGESPRPGMSRLSNSCPVTRGAPSPGEADPCRTGRPPGSPRVRACRRALSRRTTRQPCARRRTSRKRRRDGPSSAACALSG